MGPNAYTATQPEKNHVGAIWSRWPRAGEAGASMSTQLVRKRVGSDARPVVSFRNVLRCRDELVDEMRALLRRESPYICAIQPEIVTSHPLAWTRAGTPRKYSRTRLAQSAVRTSFFAFDGLAVCIWRQLAITSHTTPTHGDQTRSVKCVFNQVDEPQVSARLWITRDNNGNVRPLLPRSFNTLSQAEEENGQSRIYLGIHWSFDKTAGIAQGRRIADYVFANAFQRVN